MNIMCKSYFYISFCELSVCSAYFPILGAGNFFKGLWHHLHHYKSSTDDLGRQVWQPQKHLESR